MPLWVLCSLEGAPLDDANVRKAMALKAMTWPIHFTPHGLRHTARLILQQGESVVYVNVSWGTRRMN